MAELFHNDSEHCSQYVFLNISKHLTIMKVFERMCVCVSVCVCVCVCVCVHVCL